MGAGKRGVIVGFRRCIHVCVGHAITFLFIWSFCSPLCALHNTYSLMSNFEHWCPIFELLQYICIVWSAVSREVSMRQPGPGSDVWHEETHPPQSGPSFGGIWLHGHPSHHSKRKRTRTRFLNGSWLSSKRLPTWKRVLGVATFRGGPTHRHLNHGHLKESHLVLILS